MTVSVASGAYGAEQGRVLTPVNEYGTPITRLVCRTCKRPFTVCPALPTERLDEWQHCMADDCPSYDIDRDPTYLFEPDEPDLHERSA